jgi:hypothetical protein
MKVYDRSNIPEYAKDTIEKLIEKGLLKPSFSISENILYIILNKEQRGEFD